MVSWTSLKRQTPPRFLGPNKNQSIRALTLNPNNVRHRRTGRPGRMIHARPHNFPRNRSAHFIKSHIHRHQPWPAPGSSRHFCWNLPGRKIECVKHDYPPAPLFSAEKRAGKFIHEPIRISWESRRPLVIGGGWWGAPLIGVWSSVVLWHFSNCRIGVCWPNELLCFEIVTSSKPDLCWCFLV